MKRRVMSNLEVAPLGNFGDRGAIRRLIELADLIGLSFIRGTWLADPLALVDSPEIPGITVRCVQARHSHRGFEWC
jgi:hypothetical protein